VNAVSSGVTNSGGAVGSFRYGGYGAYGYDYTRGMTRREQQSARTQVRANEKSTGAASVQQIRQQMQEASAQIRREMTKKYQIEF
jgi:16S rRNA C1402 (ribose-2'-O) methylase RsmI